MRMRAFWMLGLALVLAGAAVFLAQNWLQSQKPQIVEVPAEPQVQMATVVVAATPLYFGNTIRREHLREIEWPAGAVPPGSFSSIEDLLGANDERRVALRAIEINEPVLKNKVSGFGGRASLSTILSPEMRAATIRVNDINGVAGFILPGDHVDIMLTRPTGSDSETNLLTDILLQNVKVLAIDQDANEDRAQPAVVKAVTLEVTPVQAQKLVLAQRLGQLSLALRNVTNAVAEKPKTVTLSDLRVGEVNQSLGETPKPAEKTVVVKQTPKKKKEGLSVRIVRGLATTNYEVQPERKPLFSSPSESKALDLMTNTVAPSPSSSSGLSTSQLSGTATGPIVSKPVSAPMSLLAPNDEKAAALEGAAAE
jgi:pilus assembly protein CpaB